MQALTVISGPSRETGYTVVVRIRTSHEGVDLAKLSVVTVRDFGGRPMMALAGEMTGVAESLRRQFVDVPHLPPTRDVDLTKIEGWEFLPAEHQQVIKEYLACRRALDPAWIALEGAVGNLKEAQEYAAAIETFAGAVKQWLPRYNRALAALQNTGGHGVSTFYIDRALLALEPDTRAIVRKVGSAAQRFPDDADTREALLEFGVSVVQLPGFSR